MARVGVFGGRWIPAAVIVYSGLTASSAGDGANRRSVVHARLAEDLDAGRLKLPAGHALCGSSGGRVGWSRVDAAAAVTCKRCSERLVRYQLADQRVPRPAGADLSRPGDLWGDL